MSGPDEVFRALTEGAAGEDEAYRRLLDHVQRCADCNGDGRCRVGGPLREALKEARRWSWMRKRRGHSVIGP
jgi:hypothetical protein